MKPGVTIFELRQTVPVLVDTGAMLNVVSTDLIKQHKLTANDRAQVRLKFGGGNEIPVNQSILLTLS